MKKVKSILAAALALCICFSMAGCESSGEQTEADIERELETLNEENLEEKLIELDESVAATESTTESKDVGVITPTDEILSADIYSSKFQINNTVITFPATAAQLQEAGVIFQVEPDTTAVQAGQEYSATITVNGEEARLVYFCNETDEPQLLKDCIIYAPPFKEKIILPKGITVGTPIDELVSKWGEPTVNNLDHYIYVDKDVGGFYGYNYSPTSATGNKYTIYLDLETKTVSKYKIECQTETDEMVYLFDDDYADKYYCINCKVPQKFMDGLDAYTYNDTLYALLANYVEVGFTTESKLPISELSESALKEYLDKKAEDNPNYSYSYKLTDSGASIIERKNKADGHAECLIKYVDSELMMYEFGVNVYQKDKKTAIPIEALEVLDDTLYSIGETIKFPNE